MSNLTGEAGDDVTEEAGGKHDWKAEHRGELSRLHVINLH